MGVVYKLKQEITDFILGQKQNQPHLSCRGISKIIEERFQIKVSKSSINAIIKEAGLSLPVGRRQKRKQKAKLIPALPKIEENLTKLLEKPISEETAPLKKPQLSKKEPETEKEVVKPAQEVPAAIPQEPVIEKKPEEAPKEEIPLLLSKALPLSPEVTPEEIAAAEETQKIIEEEALPAAAGSLSLLPEEEMEERPELPCNGTVILKAADYSLGLSRAIKQVAASKLGTKLNLKEENLLNRTEGLIFLPMFSAGENRPEELGLLWALINKKIPRENLDTYAKMLELDKAAFAEIKRRLSEVAQEVRCIQISFSEHSTIYLDGQLHTIWSTQYLPYDFSVSMQDATYSVDKFFFKEEPLLFFTAPGYDTPPKEFFNFLYNQEHPQKKIAKIVLRNSKLEELKTLPVAEHTRKHFFIFGMWPWQFVEFRRVKRLGEFKPFHFARIEKDVYLADVEIELFGPTMQTSVTMRGFALKTNLIEKTRLLILSNLSLDKIKPEYLANLYLNNWPNMEECFQDYSRKIERFTYAANIQRSFSYDNEKLYTPSEETDIKKLLESYLSSLDLYNRWRFLPRGYEDSDFKTTRERFYDLPVTLINKTDYIKAIFSIPKGYPFLSDLEYACRRLNECQMELSEGKPTWFSYVL